MRPKATLRGRSSRSMRVREERRHGVPLSQVASTIGLTAQPASDRSSAADDANEHHDDGDHEEDVDEAAHRVGADEPERPEEDQDYGKRWQHGGLVCSRRAVSVNWRLALRTGRGCRLLVHERSRYVRGRRQTRHLSRQGEVGLTSRSSNSRQGSQIRSWARFRTPRERRRSFWISGQCPSACPLKISAPRVFKSFRIRDACSSLLPERISMLYVPRMASNSSTAPSIRSNAVASRPVADSVLAQPRGCWPALPNPTTSMT